MRGDVILQDSIKHGFMSQPTSIWLVVSGIKSYTKIVQMYDGIAPPNRGLTCR